MTNDGLETPIVYKPTLERELTELLSRYSAESVSGTPDFILVELLLSNLKSYNEAVSKRAVWRNEFTDFDTRKKDI